MIDPPYRCHAEQRETSGYSKARLSWTQILRPTQDDKAEGGRRDARPSYLLPRSLFVVMLSSAKHLAKPWPSGAGTDPSLYPGCHEFGSR